MSGMRIVLINAPWYFKDFKNNEMRFGVRSGSRWPFTIEYQRDYVNRYRPFPFWLAYAYSLLKKNDIDVHFIDAITRGDTYNHFYSTIEELQPSYVFMELSTPSIENDMLIIEAINAMGIKVLVGGTHATVFAKELIQRYGVYAVFTGQYEYSLLDFMYGDQVSMIYPTRPFDIDLMPFPYRDDNLIWLYRERTHGYKPFQISLLSSRGCPYDCIFCQWPKVMYEGKVRERSIENIDKEIGELVWRYGKNIFLYFDDDTFNLKDKRTIDIAKRISKYGLEWSAMCRIDTLYGDTWKILHECGLTHINIGIESASPILLKKVNKKLDIELAKHMVEYVRSLGIYIHATFMFGIPGETEEDVALTSEFYDTLEIESKQQSICIPLPGTTWWQQLNKEQREKICYDGHRDWRNKL